MGGMNSEFKNLAGAHNHHITDDPILDPHSYDPHPNSSPGSGGRCVSMFNTSELHGHEGQHEVLPMLGVTVRFQVAPYYCYRYGRDMGLTKEQISMEVSRGKFLEESWDYFVWDAQTASNISVKDLLFKAGISKEALSKDYLLKQVFKDLNRVSNAISFNKKRNNIGKVLELEKKQKRLVNEALAFLGKNGAHLFVDKALYNVSDNYRLLVHLLGYDSTVLSLKAYFDVYDVSAVLKLDDSVENPVIHSKFITVGKVHAGRLHPAKHLWKGKEVAKRVISDILVFQELLGRAGVVKAPRYLREGLTTSRQAEIMHFVFTLPEHVSLQIAKELNDSFRKSDKLKTHLNLKHSKTLRLAYDAVKLAIYRFVKHLVVEEKLPVHLSKLQIGGLINIHLVGEHSFKPHVHFEVFLFSWVLDKKANALFRINPHLEARRQFFDTNYYELLRSLWKEALIQKGVLNADFEKELDVFVDRYFKVDWNDVSAGFHKFTYASRKHAVDVNKLSAKLSEGELRELAWFRAMETDALTFIYVLLSWSNPTIRLGYFRDVEYFVSRFSDAIINAYVDIYEKELNDLLTDKELGLSVDDARISALQSFLNNPSLDFIFNEIKQLADNRVRKHRVLEDFVRGYLKSLLGVEVVNVEAELIHEGLSITQLLEYLQDHLVNRLFTYVVGRQRKWLHVYSVPPPPTH